MSLESSMSLKKLIFVSLTEDDRSESLMALSEDLTGQLWKEKGTQRCLLTCSRHQSLQKFEFQLSKSFVLIFLMILQQTI